MTVCGPVIPPITHLVHDTTAKHQAPGMVSKQTYGLENLAEEDVDASTHRPEINPVRT